MVEKKVVVKEGGEDYRMKIDSESQDSLETQLYLRHRLRIRCSCNNADTDRVPHAQRCLQVALVLMQSYSKIGYIVGIQFVHLSCLFTTDVSVYMLRFVILLFHLS